MSRENNRNYSTTFEWIIYCEKNFTENNLEQRLVDARDNRNLFNDSILNNSVLTGVSQALREHEN